MMEVIIVIFLALLFYFVLKLLYNAIIILLIAQIIGRIKANGSEMLKKFNEERKEEENGEKG